MPECGQEKKPLGLQEVEIAPLGTLPAPSKVGEVDHLQSRLFQPTAVSLLQPLFVRGAVADDGALVHEPHHSVCVPGHIALERLDPDHLGFKQFFQLRGQFGGRSLMITRFL